MPELISSHTNPIVKQIRALRQRKGREETGLFLVEGIHHVGEAVEAGWGIEMLVYAPDQLTSEFARRLVGEQSMRGVRCMALTPELFHTISEKDNPQGILAVIHQRHSSLGEISPKQMHFGTALISPQDPGNVGTILRNLDAVGADGLFLLDGGVDPYHPSSIRASMGTIFWKNLVQTSFVEFVNWARANGYQLVGSSAHVKLDYHSFKHGGQPLILVLGNEQKGLSQDQMAACDVNLCIPMNGRVSSLNLAVAAGILMYSVFNERE
ncbi:MAG: RNA methyltransferase [Anaerolineales bacterium]|jgi:TrmH family RNA methyltransferase